jgi:hypothetical protein
MIMLAGDIGLIEIKPHKMLRYYMEVQLGFDRSKKLKWKASIVKELLSPSR